MQLGLFRRFPSLLSVFVLYLLGLSCTELPGAVTVYPDHPNLRYMGWFDRRSPKAVRFAWPATHITAQFTGKSLRVRLTDTPAEADSSDTDAIVALIDAAPPKTVVLEKGAHNYPIATGLGSGIHRVVIWKKTEAEVGTITFHGLLLDGSASVLPLSNTTARRMVFIGDSITAGFGNEGRSDQRPCGANFQNSYKTYGAYAARELGADYVAMAWSGKGLTRNYQDGDLLTISKLYERVIPTETNSPRIGLESADVVVVNIGTNDFFKGIPNPAKFIKAYESLLQRLRSRYGKALLVLVLGPMVADDYPEPKTRSILRGWIETVRARLHSSGDTNTEFIELWMNPSEGTGCEAHPNVETHARLGRELAEVIKRRLSW
jgi:lysophospholipase L1-like esterase